MWEKEKVTNKWDQGGATHDDSLREVNSLGDSTGRLRLKVEREASPASGIAWGTKNYWNFNHDTPSTYCKGWEEYQKNPIPPDNGGTSRECDTGPPTLSSVKCHDSGGDHGNVLRMYVGTDAEGYAGVQGSHDIGYDGSPYQLEDWNPGTTKLNPKSSWPFGFEFWVRFDQEDRPWRFCTGDFDGNYYIYGVGEPRWGIGFFDGSLWATNIENNNVRLQWSYKNDYDNWAVWYNDENSYGISAPGYEDAFVELRTLDADTWYHIQLKFVEEVTPPGGIPSSYECWEYMVTVTEEDGSYDEYGPFIAHYPSTIAGDDMWGFCLDGQSVDAGHGGPWRDYEVWVDAFACLFDPYYFEGGNFDIPDEAYGEWISAEYEWDYLQIIKDITISADNDNGVIKLYYRFKEEADDWSDWVEYDWENIPDLYLICDALQVKITFDGDFDETYSPYLDELVFRYLPAVCTYDYRNGLVGKLRDTLARGDYGQGDMKKWSLMETSQTEQLNLLLHEIGFQRFLNGGELFGYEGKAYRYSLDLWGQDLGEDRGDLSDSEYSQLLKGAMSWKSGTPSFLTESLRQLCGIEQGLGYAFRDDYPKEGDYSNWYYAHSSIDGRIDLIEWWAASGWILGGAFSSYLRDVDPKSDLILGDPDALDLFEYQFRIKGYEGWPYYHTSFNRWRDFASAFIVPGSPFITMGYLYVNPVTSPEPINTNRISFSLYGTNPNRTLLYRHPLTFRRSGEEIAYDDGWTTPKTFFDVLPNHMYSVEYYDGSDWYPLEEEDDSGGFPSSGECYIHYTGGSERTIVLANPVIPAGHAWQSGDVLRISYEAYGLDPTLSYPRWVPFPLNSDVSDYIGGDGWTTKLLLQVIDGAGGENGDQGIQYGSNSWGYPMCWWEELAATYEQIKEFVDKYKTICTVPRIKFVS